MEGVSLWRAILEKGKGKGIKQSFVPLLETRLIPRENKQVFIVFFVLKLSSKKRKKEKKKKRKRKEKKRKKTENKRRK